MLRTEERAARLLPHSSTQQTRCITRPRDYVAPESSQYRVTPKHGHVARSDENLVRATLRGSGRTACAAAQLGTCRNRMWEHSAPQDHDNSDRYENARYCSYHQTCSHLGSPFIFIGVGKRSFSGAGNRRSPWRQLHPSGRWLFRHHGTHSLLVDNACERPLFMRRLFRGPVCRPSRKPPGLCQLGDQHAAINCASSLRFRQCHPLTLFSDLTLLVWMVAPQRTQRACRMTA